MLVLGLPLLPQGMDGPHHRVVVEADTGHAAAHAAVILEIDRQRGTAPRQAEHGLEQAGADHVEAGVGRVRNQFLLPQVTTRVTEAFEDGGGGANGHAGSAHARATGQGGGFQGVDTGGFQGQFGGDLGEGVHVGQRGRQQQAGLAVQLAELVAQGTDVLLLTGRVQVMAAGFQGRLGGGQTEIDERTDRIADHFCALEDGSQGLDLVRALDDLVGGRLQADDALRHHLLGTLGIPGHGSEGNLLVNQPVHGEHAGVTTGAIDNDRIFGHLGFLAIVLG
ncbi:hypothetical protein D9M70_462100 [compost metagenome]